MCNRKGGLNAIVCHATTVLIADCGVAVFLSRQKLVVKMVCVSRDVCLRGVLLCCVRIAQGGCAIGQH
jgi:hypothetical protein